MVVMELLDRSFFERPADDVARDFVGAFMSVVVGDEKVTVRLVETEAHGGTTTPLHTLFVVALRATEPCSDRPGISTCTGSTESIGA